MLIHATIPIARVASIPAYNVLSFRFHTSHPKTTSTIRMLSVRIQIEIISNRIPMESFSFKTAMQPATRIALDPALGLI